MRGNDKYDVKETKESLYMIRKLYGETELDPSFQRLGGMENGSGWSTKESEGYMSSLFMGSVFNKVMLAAVDSCLRHAKDEQDQESEDYFQALQDQGRKYVSIDGNNTSSTISCYLDNKFSVYTDECKSKRGKGYPKKYFKDLSEAEQADLQYTEKLTLYTFRRIGIAEMCELFRRENTSTHLNKQEYRQASWSSMAKFIREEANTSDNRKIFTNLMALSSADLDKRKHEEAFARFVYKVETQYARDAQASNLDAFYENASELPTAIERHAEKVMRLIAAMAKNLKLIKKFSLTPGLIQALFDLVGYICKEHKDIKISNPPEFFNWFLEQDLGFKAISNKIQEDEKNEKSYIYWLTVHMQITCFTKTNLLFKDAFLQNFNDFIDAGVISRLRTNKDYFSADQKLELFRRQEGLLRTGKKISLIDLYTGTLEADHVVSVKDGGETTIENGELMTIHENRQKGPSSNQPHFDHQREH
jgi:hypothetical protein